MIKRDKKRLEVKIVYTEVIISEVAVKEEIRVLYTVRAETKLQNSYNTQAAAEMPMQSTFFK